MFRVAVGRWASTLQAMRAGAAPVASSRHAGCNAASDLAWRGTAACAAPRANARARAHTRARALPDAAAATAAAASGACVRARVCRVFGACRASGEIARTREGRATHLLTPFPMFLCCVQGGLSRAGSMKLPAASGWQREMHASSSRCCFQTSSGSSSSLWRRRCQRRPRRRTSASCASRCLGRDELS